jgi:hypothetical protein
MALSGSVVPEADCALEGFVCALKAELTPSKARPKLTRVAIFLITELRSYLEAEA